MDAMRAEVLLTAGMFGLDAPKSRTFVLFKPVDAPRIVSPCRHITSAFMFYQHFLSLN